MRKSCELCKRKAGIYCDSDKAFLCCTCDATVHSANFLVARHARNLLCHVCQSLTEWTASGKNVGTAVSVCRNCVGDAEDLRGTDENDDCDAESVEGVGEEYDDWDVESDDDDELDENQIVPPWKTDAPLSTEEEPTNDQPIISRKHMRYNGGENEGANTNQIARTPATTAELVAVAVTVEGACGERNGVGKDKSLVETSSTLTYSIKTMKRPKLEIGIEGTRTLEVMATQRAVDLGS